LTMAGAGATENRVQVMKLRCEYLTDPLGIDVTRPRLSWISASEQRGEKQTAFQILVSSSRKNLADGNGDLWDSGKIDSDHSIQVVYRGKPLTSMMRCYWKVRIWDAKGNPSPWSEPAVWSMGQLHPSEWKAQWIGPEPEDREKIGQVNNGFHSQWEESPDQTKWLAIDLGESYRIAKIKLFPARPFETRRDYAGFLFPVRFRVDVAENGDFIDYRTVIDHTGEDQNNPGESVWAESFEPAQARWVRLVVTKLARFEDNKFEQRMYGLALAEMEVLDEKGRNLSQAKPVTASDTMEYLAWSLDKLVDGVTERQMLKSEEPVIPPSPLLRKKFSLKSQPRRALIYVTSLGDYQLKLNGQAVSNHILAPEWTDYNKRLQYQTYDVTELLEEGENSLAATLADGWYAGRLAPVRWSKTYPRRGIYGMDRRLLLQMEVEYADGSHETICSDGSWKMYLDGPIRSADNFLGEVYDARKEVPGWDQACFDDSAWQVVTVDRTVQKNLVAQMNEPIRIYTHVKPVAITEPQPGNYIFNMGQNMVGWVRIKLGGAAGREITLRHGEVLNQDGSLFTANLGSAAQTDKFILDGGPARWFEPHFTFHGFQYVEVSGLEEKPTLEQLEGCAFSSSAPQAGQFACSNPMLNKLWDNILWTQRDNMDSIPTDCPQRDERMGWMGDALVFSQTAIFNLDMAAFFNKWIKDVRDAQARNGQYPDFAPLASSTIRWGAPGWADAGVVVPWKVYLNYADQRVLEEHYDSVKRFITCRLKQDPDLIWGGGGYGDWLNGDTIDAEGYPKEGGQVPNEVYGTAFFAHSTALLAQMAKVLGKFEEAEHYFQLADKIRQVFNDRFVAENGVIKGDTQAGYAIALNFDLLPEKLRLLAAEHLVKAFERYDGRISTGFQSTFRMMLELSRWGHNDLAYQLIESTRFPSWGYSIEQGATTIWERWDAYVASRGVNTSAMNSFNHYSIGAVGEWMYKDILGINPDEGNPGYKHIIIRPRPGGTITWARGHYDSIHGRIETSWQINVDRLNLEITIPANTTATVFIPAAGNKDVTESGLPADQAPGVKFIRMSDSAAVYGVGSGTYHFSCPSGK